MAGKTGKSRETLHRRPLTWMVSTSHSRPVRQADGTIEREPYSTHHARQFGVNLTACGLAAHNWVNFYELEFTPGAALTCRECSQAVRMTATHEAEW